MNLNKNTRILKTKWSKFIIGFIILAILSTFFISLYVGLKLVTPKREELSKLPKDYGLVYDNISFNSKYDKVLLKGWWIPAQNNGQTKESKKTIIFSHGYGDSKALLDISVLNLAKRLCGEGYNVLTFDFRAEGESEGKYVSLGAFEKYDLLTAVDFAKRNKHSDKIGLIGWSMGAVTSILAGAETKNVQAVIADSPFSNLKDYLKENLPYWSNLPNFPFTRIILTILPKIVKVNIEDVNTLKAVKNFTNKDLLLIHSKDDKAISYKNSENLYETCKNSKHIKLWLTEKCDHIRSYNLYKDKYEESILKFLNGNLK